MGRAGGVRSQRTKDRRAVPGKIAGHRAQRDCAGSR